MLRSKSQKPKRWSDEKLFRAVIQGREDLFGEFYNRYSQRLLYYFYRMLGNDEHLVQDFLQELFFKILKNAEQYDSNRKFSTWIFSIAYNMCKNEYRRMEVRKIVVQADNMDSFLQEEAHEKESPVTALDIYKELENLDDSHKSAFLLKYREGLEISEISEILNLPVGTVKSRLFYARKKIQANLLNKMQQTSARTTT